jgi:hypothetical protein
MHYILICLNGAFSKPQQKFLLTLHPGYGPDLSSLSGLQLSRGFAGADILKLSESSVETGVI